MERASPVEVVLSSDLRGAPYNFALWDVHTGTLLVAFKGGNGNPIPRCLQTIDNNYFITAHDNLLHIWSIFNRKCQDRKLFLPGRPTSLCVSPCGNYVAAGIEEMIYTWQLHSGNLLAHTQRHYQKVSVLKMNKAGTFLFSAGEDGYVFAWPFADLVSQNQNTATLKKAKKAQNGRNQGGHDEPKFSWQHHSSPVTDLHVTNSGLCISVSMDMTFNVYSYRTGRRLACVNMPSPLASVIMNRNETRMWLGAFDGNIYEVATSSLGVAAATASKENGESRPILSGHKGKVVGLLLSLDGSRLISASGDSTCKVWDVRQRKLIQDIKHQAPLANLVTLLVPDGLALTTMTQSKTQPPLPFKALKRAVHRAQRDEAIVIDDIFEESATTIVYVKNRASHKTMLMSNGIYTCKPKSDEPKSDSLALDKSQPDKDGATVAGLKKKIRDLFILSSEKIFNDAAHESLKQFKALARKEARPSEEAVGHVAKKRRKR